MKLLLPVVAFATLVAGEAFAACSNPVGPAGAMMWNADYSVVQVCNGTSWVALGGNSNDGSGEVDPQVGTVTDGKWCTASGGVVTCTSDAPLASVSLDALTDVTLTAPGLNHILRHDGTGWVNTPVSSLVSASGDRITSNTTSMIANQNGYISLTTGGVNTGYVDTAGRLVVPGISITTLNGISSTVGYFSRKLTVESELIGDVAANLVNTSGDGYGLRVQGGGGADGLYLAAFNDSQGNNRVIIDNNGRLGLGTLTPGAMLAVRGTSATNDALQLWGVGGGSGSYSSLELVKTADTAGDFIFRAFHSGQPAAGKIGFGRWDANPLNGAQLLLDTSSGNVGIG